MRQEILELLIQGVYCLLEHPLVGGRAGAAEVGSRPCPREFQHPPAFFNGPLFWRQARPRTAPAAGCFFLLGFD